MFLLVLCVGEYTLGPNDAAGWRVLERLIWSGIAVGPDEEGVVSISSPLLLRALMIAATDSGSLPDLPPLPNTLTSRYGQHSILLS
jgi:hypothetical protein